MRLRSLSSGRLVWHKCSHYRIDWEKKSRSQYQTDLKAFLRPFLENHIVYEEFFIPGSRMSIDIFDATTMIAYEMQGEFHTSFNKWAHGTKAGYRNQIVRDLEKGEWCVMNNITLVEVFPEDFPLSKEFFKEKYKINL